MMIAPKTYRIFIASPGDVLHERETAFRVIELVNRKLKETFSAAQLEVAAWERAHPDIGLPQDVILKQIPITECDILVAIFWKRFGLPPGSQRPSDGRPYLSGTERELDEAIHARQLSKNDRPAIMIYRKLDPVPAEMSDEDFEQLQRVRIYLKSFEPGGTTPALISKFTGDQFAEQLTENLLKVIALFQQAEKNDKPARRPQRSENPPGPPESPESEEDTPLPDRQAVWLDAIGLRDNPFAQHTADDEQDLPRYFITPDGVHLPNLIDSKRPNVVLGQGGTGKTALRRIVAASCFPARRESTTLALECGRRELEGLIELADDRLERPQSVHVAQILAGLAWQRIRQLAADRVLLLSDTLTDQFKWLEAPAVGQPLSKWLSAFEALATGVGLKRLLFQIDQVDELGLVQQQPDRVLPLLSSLFSLELRETRGAAFNYYLPLGFETLLMDNTALFRLDRCNDVAYIRWTDSALKRLLQQRLRAFSKGPVARLISLGQVCEGNDDFARLIDSELAALAAGNPRAALWLGNHLIEFHCEADDPPLLIQPETWRRVRAHWWLQGRPLFFPQATFWMYQQRVYFHAREVVLIKRSEQLLACLVRAEGRVCERHELAEAAWPKDNASGVSPRAIEEAIRRMKLELERQNIDPKWIHTVRGRGYRLAPPEAIGKNGEEDEVMNDAAK